MNFQHVCVLNLECRPDRLAAFWGRFPASWPWARPQRVAGLDGAVIERPHWFKETPGTWGCLRTHLRCMEDAMNAGVTVGDGDSPFVFEDDTEFLPSEEFGRKLAAFVENVPDDWDMIHLGGLHRAKPEPVNDHVLRVTASSGTWAYGVRAESLPSLYRLLHEMPQGHIDSMCAWATLALGVRAYAPTEWLCGHAPGPSDISGMYLHGEHWQGTLR